MDAIQLSGFHDGKLSLYAPALTGYNRIWRSDATNVVIRYYEGAWTIFGPDAYPKYMLVVAIESGTIEVPDVGKCSAFNIEDPWHPSTFWIDRETKEKADIKTSRVDDQNTKKTVRTSVDDYGNQVVVETYTDLLTGNTHSVSKVTRVETVKQFIAEHERSTPMDLAVGRIYQFRFVPDFEKLGLQDGEGADSQQGIYRVDKIIPYMDVLDKGIDLYRNIYKPCNLPYSLYTEEKKTFFNQKFYKLTNPNDERQSYYIPQSIIVGTPDPSVKEHPHVLVSMDLGIAPSDEQLEEFKQVLEYLMEERYGIDPAKTRGIQMAIYHRSYMNDQAYDALEQSRDETKRRFVEEHGDALATLLWPKETGSLVNENSRLKAWCKAYEEIIINQERRNGNV